ncbi:MAG: SPOR domain-containing protein, partial [Rubrivivax sp.]|nr:SPOR domain-containing protein [Rubrivivax sp.]
MPLPSFLPRKDKTPKSRRNPSAPADDAGPVQLARVQARRRLIGAVVLLAIGIIGLPLLFDSQPRPLPVDIPIETARDAGAAARSTGKVAAPAAADTVPAKPEAAAPAP